MISANLINNLKDSKKRNKDIIKVYKQRAKRKNIEEKDRVYFANMSILLESENKDIDNMIKRYHNVENRKRKKHLGVY